MHKTHLELFKRNLSVNAGIVRRIVQPDLGLLDGRHCLHLMVACCRWRTVFLRAALSVHRVPSSAALGYALLRATLIAQKAQKSLSHEFRWLSADKR